MQINKNLTDNFWNIVKIKKITILNEEFNVFQEQNFDGIKTIQISHSQWDLKGKGKHIIEATTNLLKEAAIALDYQKDIPENNLSLKALQLKRFLESLERKQIIIT